VVEATEDAIEATRAGLAPRIGADLLGLRRHRADQRLFARHARSLAEAVADLLDAPDPQQEATGDDRTALLLPESEGDGGRAAAAGGSVGAATDGYQVFTTAFDRQHDVGTLLRAELLARHRASLSELIAERRVPVNRLVRELTALFAFPVADGWDGAQESGRLDGRMLARLITTPTERRLFRIERTAPAVDVLVTFLVDCSGSMKSRRTDVAVLVDVFARALELAGGDTEVLGFTTGAWHGGRARRDWQRAGRPPRPGRLNERCHLVFKPAGVTWRRSRRQIAGLLATELFREGIDGEAVEWAATRACSRPARRRLLVVLGDGSPMDRATALVNGDDLLDQHLRDVVADLERDGSVEVYGLGIDADVSGHYRRHARLDTLPGHGFQPFLDLLDLIAQAHP
jgi:cobaltochelatase CobT